AADLLESGLIDLGLPREQCERRPDLVQRGLGVPRRTSEEGEPCVSRRPVSYPRPENRTGLVQVAHREKSQKGYLPRPRRGCPRLLRPQVRMRTGRPCRWQSLPCRRERDGRVWPGMRLSASWDEAAWAWCIRPGTSGSTAWWP